MTSVITAVRARPVLVPLDRPLRTASGSIPAAPLLLLDVDTDAGVTGSSYLFGYTPVTLAPMTAIVDQLAPELVGKTVRPPARLAEFEARFRLLGMAGLLGMVVSGIDMALWDALGKQAGEPVATLLGGEVTAMPAYDSFGMLDPARNDDDATALRDAVAAGFRAVKTKIGFGTLAEDVAAVGATRAVLGPGVHLMLDYNQSLDPPEAIRRIRALREFDPYWIEEPVPAEDLDGHAEVRRATGIPIQTGENWWFPRGMRAAVTAGAADFAMLDVMKIGGVTGWQRAAGQADGASLPVSSHLFIEASPHLMALTPTAHWLEHLDVAGPVLATPHRPVNGTLTPVGPGLGISWDEDAVARYRTD